MSEEELVDEDPLGIATGIKDDDEETNTFLKRVNNSSSSDLRRSSLKLDRSKSRETINSNRSNSNPTKCSQDSIPSAADSSTSSWQQKSPDIRLSLSALATPGGGGGGGQSASGHDTNDDCDYDEDGAHDTITSLAGVQMLQKYRRNIIAGSSRQSSLTSLNHTKLEDLFHEEPLLEDEHDAVDLASSVSGSVFGPQQLPSIDKMEGTCEVSEEPREESKVEISGDEFVPPDGGYGWFVALGTFISIFWAAGMVKSYGILFSEILVTFPDASVTIASWIPASMTTLALAMAPIASALCIKFSCRYVTFLGSILCALGIMLSSLANGVPFLFFTFGVLTGIGVGFCTTPGIILTARYFGKKRALANMFCLSGSCAGSFIIPFLIQYLLDQYGFRGTVLLLGAFMFHISISAALYRPLNVHKKIQLQKYKPIMNSKYNKPPPEQPIIQLHKNEKINGHNESKDSSSTHSHTHLIRHSHHYHHHHQQGHPADLIAVQKKLRSLTSDSLDNISMNSSISSSSQINHHHHHFKSSFTSVACSLPPNLDQHNYHRNCNGPSKSATASMLTSREELYSPEASPRFIRSSGFHQSSSRIVSAPSYEKTEAKPLTLRELYKYQIGSRLSLYKNYILGLETHQNNTNLQKNKVDSIRKESKPYSSLNKSGFRVSLMFSMEDMMTDSTSILKDSTRKLDKNRKPSVIENYQKNQKSNNINLNRSVSCATPDKNSSKVRRLRYLSEREQDNKDESIEFLQRSSSPSHPIALEPPTPKTSRFKCVPAVDDRMITMESNVQKDEDKVKEEEEKEKVEVEVEEDGKKNLKGIQKYLELGLVKDPMFILMALTVMAMSVGFPHVLFFLPAHAHSMGFDASASSSFLAICSIADLFGRVGVTILLDRNLVPKHIVYSTVILMAGLSVLCLPKVVQSGSYMAIAAIISLYGIGAGSWFLMVPLLLAEYLGVEKISSSYGLVRLFQSGANLTGPIFAGTLKDWTGTYDTAFYFMGSIMTCGSFIALFKPVFKRN